MNFCRRCGQALTQANRHVYQCPEGHIIFANTSPTVGIFFVSPDKKEVLLSTRGIEPQKGMLDSFGGFLDGEETLEHAAIRELEEEVGLMPSDYTELTYFCSSIGHYDYRGETLPVLTAFYWAELKPGVVPVPADDVAAVQYVPIHEIDMDSLRDIDIRKGVKALQQLFPEK